MKTDSKGQKNTTQIVKPFDANNMSAGSHSAKAGKVVPSLKQLKEQQAKQALAGEGKKLVKPYVKPKPINQAHHINKSVVQLKSGEQPKTVEQPEAVASKPEPPEMLHEEDSSFEYSKPKKRKGVFARFIEKRFARVSKLLDSIEADFEDRSTMKKTFIALLKLKTPICVFLVLVIVFSSCYFLFTSSNTATTEMSLNYEESAYGLNPNSTRLNVYDIASPSVVEKMLSYAGIDPKSVDVNSVSDCISINPTNRKDFSEEEPFITTTYRIKLKRPPEIKGVSTKQLLNFLCKAYKDNLYSKYTENRSILSFDIEKYNDGEYMEIADLLDLKAQQIEKYLNLRVKQSKTFTEKESDETFKSLVQKAEDIRTYDIAKYRAFVIEAGCSNDKARYMRSLSYINRMKNLDYTKEMAAYNVHNDGIKMYNESMISVVMIPSIDESKRTYYMSKTKTGMDYMASQADDYLENAQTIDKEIQTNDELMEKMGAGNNSASDIEKAKGMIDAIRKKFSDLSAQIETVDKAYIKYKTKDYLTFKMSNPSLLQQIQPDKVFVITAAAFMAIYIAIWYRFRNYSGGK